ncbi:hypothetical protein OC846_000406 [Tilletia horrida]|uniref:Selenoprotein O n=1 Tax=Tilletia horrida TaxID=155126 RepID=A0AAN6JUM5_9BASI|nr:hypothetical protein OC845_000005 [Tilletia horrida]KAK0557618.1 hypothetical protein OC846_000406 [Tilletia horrida]
MAQPDSKVDSSSNSKNMTAAAAAASASKRFSILSLPLLDPASRLATNLLPDAFTPSARSLVLAEGEPAHPSYLRRSRPVAQGAHFSYVTPLPIEFPYEIPTADVAHSQSALSDPEKARLRLVQMEEYMKEWEIDREEANALAGDKDSPASPALKLFVPSGRTQAPPSSPFRLLGLSPSALPQLDLGDAREHILARSGKADDCTSLTSGPGITPPKESEDPAAYKRWAISEVLSGHGIAARFATSSPASIGATNGSTQSEADIKIDDPHSAIGVTYLKWQEARNARFPQTLGGGAQSEEKRNFETDTTLARLQALRERQESAASSQDWDVMPWAQAYAGHQFGEWAGQLGDGRAVSLFEVNFPTPITSTKAFPRPSTHPQPPRIDIQLKGAGRTPYSRFADGLATLQSSLREYLCAEYMGGGLGIESCRGLSVGVFTNTVQDDGSAGMEEDGIRVRRERTHPSAVMTRLAPSWVRVGSFQLHASRGEWESVRVLGEYAVQHLFRWQTFSPSTESEEKRQPWAQRLIREVAERTAITIARWQVAGFMHGVMNTDNIALLGHTIDYGPYAFMDIFDEDCICNHSDSYGRYSYKMQPSMGLFAVQHFILALSPIVGFENKHGRAPRSGELVRMSEQELKELADDGEEACKAEVRALYMRTLTREWTARWLGRLGLGGLDQDAQSAGGDQGSEGSDAYSKSDETIRKEILDPLQSVLVRLDFATHLRGLADFPVKLSEAGISAIADAADGAATKKIQKVAEDFAASWLDESHVLSFEKKEKREEAVKWLVTYAKKLQEQGKDFGEVRQAMLQTNPRFVLRNWVTNEVATRVENENDTAFLDRVLQMCLNPFHDWGSPSEGKSAEILAEENRLCSVGTPLEGHLPSCSS